MAVVSNTSPILALSAIEHLYLLQKQFDEVLIPEAVLAELKTDTDFRGTQVIRQAIEAGWLKVKSIQNTRLAQALAMEIDYGEAEAIALALETQSPIILLDEYDGRAKARALGLRPIGVLGVLLRAKQDGSIDSLRATISSLQKDVGFFVSEELCIAILKQAGEIK